MHKILLIEDDVFLGNVLVEKLKNEGFDVTLSRDGVEGFQKIKETTPDLILLDIILPNMNGYEILEAKQKDPKISNIPVIIISNSGQPVEISRALNLGVKDYLVKADFNPEDVLVKVRAQFRQQEAIKSQVQEANGSKESSTLEGKKIMWVEDDKFLNDLIARKLVSTKCIFSHSSDGEEALVMIEKEVPDIILLDIVMDEMDGIEVLKRIRADEETSDLKVILLTNLVVKEKIDEGKKFGALDYIIKSQVEPSNLVKRVRKFLKN